MKSSLDIESAAADIFLIGRCHPVDDDDDDDDTHCSWQSFLLFCSPALLARAAAP